MTSKTVFWRLWFLSLLCISQAVSQEKKIEVKATKSCKIDDKVLRFAKESGLPLTKVINLAQDLEVGFKLIPPGKFTMGTPKPIPIEQKPFHVRKVVGLAAFVIGIMIVLSLLSWKIYESLCRKKRFQFSLKGILCINILVACAFLGNDYMQKASMALEHSKNVYKARLERFEESNPEERPSHEVEILKPYYISTYEITERQYAFILGNSDDINSCRKEYPIADVGLKAAKIFCQKLSTYSGLTIELPTESEWEYACRAGTETRFYSGDLEGDLSQVAWWRKNAGEDLPCKIGQLAPNSWGLFDMHGNVDELCGDLFEDFCPSYDSGKISREGIEPRFVVVRGGHFWSGAKECRSAHREFRPKYPGGGPFSGFRVVLRVAKGPSGQDR